MAFGADGSLFFGNGGVLRRVAPDGKVAKIYDGGKGSSLRGLATATDGRVLAADMGSKSVLAFGPDGRVSTLYRETAAWLPTAVALAGGRLLVLEANADPYEYEDRVRVIEVSDGRGRVVARPAHPQAAPAPATRGGSFDGGTILLTGLAASALALAAWRFRSSRDPKS